MLNKIHFKGGKGKEARPASPFCLQIQLLAQRKQVGEIILPTWAQAEAPKLSWSFPLNPARAHGVQDGNGASLTVLEGSC